MVCVMLCVLYCVFLRMVLCILEAAQGEFRLLERCYSDALRTMCLELRVLQAVSAGNCAPCAGG